MQYHSTTLSFPNTHVSRKVKGCLYYIRYMKVLFVIKESVLVNRKSLYYSKTKFIEIGHKHNTNLCQQLLNYSHHFFLAILF